MDIVIATKNRGKIKEIRDALNRIDIKVLSLDEIGLHIEIEEDGGTYSENAVKKAVEVAKRTGKTALSDDSGLEIDALDGRPGINSSRFAGDNADDRERNLKVLEMMKDKLITKEGFLHCKGRENMGRHQTRSCGNSIKYKIIVQYV